MTTVRPAASWYADPTGRHEARYWDGFTWTAHVADAGTPGLDPLVRASPGPAADPGGEALGPGTAALRAMKETTGRREGDGPAVATARPVRPRHRAYDIAAGVAMIVVIVLGGYAAWSGMLSPGSGPVRDPGAPVPWRHGSYRLDLPPSWVSAPVPGGAGSTVDGAFQVIDSQTVIAFVGDTPEGLAEIREAGQVEAALTASVATMPNPSGATPRVTETNVDVRGDRFIGTAVVDFDVPGSTVRAVEHLVVTKRGSVVILLYGEAPGVDRHRADALVAARSVVVRV